MAERRPVNNNAQGWGVAALVVLLALACIAGAAWIHEATYCDPRDPMCFDQPGDAPEAAEHH